MQHVEDATLFLTPLVHKNDAWHWFKKQPVKETMSMKTCTKETYSTSVKKITITQHLENSSLINLHVTVKSGKSHIPSFGGMAVVSWLISVFLCMIKTATQVDVTVYACQVGLDSCGLQLNIITLQDIFRYFIYIILLY